MKTIVMISTVITFLLLLTTPLFGCQEQPPPPPEPTPMPTPAPAIAPAPTPEPPPEPTPALPPPEPVLAPATAKLESVSIAPIEVAAGETKQLEVVATDQQGNRLNEFEIVWKMIDKNAGSITENGLFTAGEVARNFDEAVEVEVTKGDVIRTATASITVTPGLLEQVVIAPNLAEIGMEMTQQFVAVGADRYGNRISGLNFSWSVENDSGAIDENGLFTAGATSGNYTNTVKVEATRGSITCSATADVTVEPDRILFISGGDIYIMDADGSNVKRHTTTREDEGAAPSDSNRIVFSKDSDIYIKDADGGNLIQLTDTVDYDESNPVLSPDGTRIVFSSYTIDDESDPERSRISFVPRDIYVINADGSDKKLLVSNAICGTTSEIFFESHVTAREHLCIKPAWSPDGTRIMFSSRGSFYIINTDGSNKYKLGSGSDAIWSPDGSQIALASIDDNIYVMNADGSYKRQLTSSSEYVAYLEPAWSPDGSKLIYVSSQYTFLPDPEYKGPGVYMTKQHVRDDLYIMDADGSHKNRLTDDSDRVITNPQWAPRKRGVEVSEDSIIIPNISTLKK